MTTSSRDRSPLDDIENDRTRNMLIDGKTMCHPIIDERSGTESMRVGLGFDGHVFRLHRFGCGTSLGVFATYAAARSHLFTLTKKASTERRSRAARRARSPLFD